MAAPVIPVIYDESAEVSEAVWRELLRDMASLPGVEIIERDFLDPSALYFTVSVDLRSGAARIYSYQNISEDPARARSR